MDATISTPEPEPSVTLLIEGMTCNGCVASVHRVLSAVPGASNVDVDLETGRALVNGTADRDALAAAVSKAGFDVVGIT